MANFQALLQEQKGKQDKEQVAISEAAQTFSLQIQKELGLGQSYIKKEGISNAAVTVVQNFQGALDEIADADFTRFKDIVETYKTLLNELEGSRRFDNPEKEYITKIISPVLAEIYPLANAFTRVRFGLRDFIKQFKPLKLSARVFGGVPILGTAIQKKIERQEAGEQELRRAERKRGQDIARESRRQIEEQIEGTAPVSPAEAIMEEPIEQPSPIVSKRTELVPQAEKAQMSAAREEAQEEQRAEQEDRFEEQIGLFEMIAESTYETNENIKKLLNVQEQAAEDGGTSITKTAVGTAAGIGGAVGAKKLLTKPGGIVQKSKDAVKKGVSKAGTIAKGAVRGAGRLFLPLAAALAIFDTAASAAQADEVLGKKEEDLTIRDRASAGVGGLLEGLSFGLIKKDKVAKFLAGSSDDAGVDTSLVPNKSEAVQAAAEVGGNVKDMVNIDSKRTIVRTQLETDGLENMLEKMMPNLPQNNVVNAPSQTINTATSNNVLPDLSNKNFDNTINSLKNVY